MNGRNYGKSRKWCTFGFVIILLLLYGLATVQGQTTTDFPETTSTELEEDVQVKVIATVYTLSFSLRDEDKNKYIITNVTCQLGTGLLIVANENHVCENLDPCSQYTAVVTFGVIDENLTPPDEKTIYAYTAYKQPSANITSLAPTATTIKVTWKATDRACVSSFKLYATYGLTSSDTEQTNEKSTYTFTGRLPCQTYNITINTYNNASLLVYTDVNQVDTDYSEPGDLTLDVNNSTNGDTVISWGDPVSSNCINLYTFKWKLLDCEVKDDETTTELPSTETTIGLDQATTTTSEPPIAGPEETPEESEDVCEWTDTSNATTLRQYTLPDLQGCDMFSFEIYMNSNTTVKGSLEFASAEKNASIIYNANQSLNFTGVNWTWSPPREHPKCVASYNVNLTGPMQRVNPEQHELNTKETFVNFENLDPCGLYIVEISPVLLNGSSVAVYQNESTINENQPTGVLEPVISPAAYSMNVSWSIPAYADLCIDGYRLSGWMDDGKEVDALSLTTQNTNVTFDSGLLACQAYTIQIIPYTKQNLDGELKQILVETRAAIVDASLISFEQTGISSHSLTLNANNVDYNNMCPTIFARFECSSNDAAISFAEKYVEGHSKRVFQAVLTPLSPYKDYNCDVTLYNTAGSVKKSLVAQKTLTYFPDQPTNVQCESASETSLVFRWSAPVNLNGPIKYYQTYLMRHEPDYFVPDANCAAIIEEPLSETKGADSVNFTQLSPAVKYMMQVAVQNEFGLGQYTAPVIGTTSPWIPDPVTDLKVTSMGPALDNNSYRANVTFEWTVPCKSNGDIEKFIIAVYGDRPNYPSIPTFNRSAELDTSDPKGRMSYTITELEPEYDYTVNIYVKNFDVEKTSTSVFESWRSPAGIPSAVDGDLLSAMRVTAQEMTHPTSSAIVRLPPEILSSESGTIKYISLLLSQKGCTADPVLQYNVIDNEWPSARTYEQVGADGSNSCIEQYQTTPERWEPEVSTVSRGDSSTEEIVYYIGIEKCSGNSPDVYCNGPLKADTEYNMVVRLYTDFSYRDAALLEFKTDAAIRVTLILVSVCCCLLVAFVLGLAVLWIRKRIAWHRDSGQGIEDPFGNVIAKNFAIFYDEVAKPEKLAREFKEITVVALELSYSAAELGTHKNRYADIYPYDKNRVILDIDAEGSDYINASFIDGYTRKKEYIATQGPKPESVMDFWRMVLQHSVRIIVQVTQYREGNTVKCHEYFPFNSRGLIATVRSKESFELYDRTELCVVHDKYGLKEKVIHFHFKKWPDHGCPEDPMHLIAFVKKVKAERRPNYSPIVVHCSAGVGRTGTFIGLDLIMQRLKSESKINIFETVKKLRFQRMKMVQTLQQYTFLYACTYELVKHKIPRVAKKQLDRRPLSGTPPPALTIKKVSFPETDVTMGSTGDRRPNGGYVSSAPDPELGMDVPTLRLPPRPGGLRKIDSVDDTDPNSISSFM
ncbi:phosphatidylinositol phosphatase PTPRQ [Drosophila tropicalis]|uniref:phosphatidylinositol phosphatase PTPRQ n=1 Tax=Drosophila tropicalis TaxID=46794 RepID=UPI0035AC23E7